jgi:type I restriction enzyme S subunit
MMLPNGWKKVKLGDVAKVTSGGTPLRTHSEYWNGYIPWVKTAQIQNGHISKDQVDEYITELGVKESSAKIVPKGTLLMAMYGQGKTRGQVAILDIDATINQACAAFHLKEDEVLTQYLFQYFLFNYENIRNLSNDGGQKNLSAEIIKKIPLDLPPIEEQKKIAATLSVWDFAIEKMEKLIDAKENEFNSALKQNLLAKGIALKWKEIPLAEIIKSVTPPSKIHQDSYLKCGKYPIVDQSKDLIAGWTNDESCVLKIDRPLIIFGDHTCALKIMRVSFAQGADGIKILSAMDGYDPVYIYYAIKANPVIPEGYKRHFSVLMLKSVFCPSFEEQKKYAAYFKSFDDELSLLKQQLENYKKQKQGLMQKLLTGEWRVK